MQKRYLTTLTVFGTALAVVLADVATKTWAVAHLEDRDPVYLVGSWFRLVLLRNSGAAFSMATGYTWVLTIIAIVVVAAIIRLAGRLRSGWWMLGLGLVLGGALGNLIDRVFRSPGVLRGHVVDFIAVGWWPVFNVADSAVVCGAALLVVLTILGFDYDGGRSGWAARRRGAVEGEGAGDPAAADIETGDTRA
ncbi:signal peptidase II [Gordonia sp. X0973]|uniref:signal peptidase II n=1 Tax=Gordonia sp. X0973 TaxID=2742602 RepID=UPI000F543639|nr:signal peptidase II [Gordonia sp. X0973]QKT07564.1 signal peptidase II [Gordonia sp. X0973]